MQAPGWRTARVFYFGAQTKAYCQLPYHLCPAIGYADASSFKHQTDRAPVLCFPRWFSLLMNVLAHQTLMKSATKLLLFKPLDTCLKDCSPVSLFSSDSSQLDFLYEFPLVLCAHCLALSLYTLFESYLLARNSFLIKDLTSSRFWSFNTFFFPP